MKAIYSHSFYPVYTSDPAATAGRIEAVINALPSGTELIEAEPAIYYAILVFPIKSSEGFLESKDCLEVPLRDRG